MRPISDEELDRLMSVAHPAAEPRPVLTDEQVDRMFTPIPKVDAGGPGLGQSFAKGLVEDAPAGVAELVGHGTDAAAWLGEKLTGISSPVDFSDGMRDVTREALRDATGVPEPVTDAEKAARAFGEGTGTGLAFAPAMAAGGAPAWMIGSEVLLSGAGAATGEAARQATEEFGGSDLVQAGANVGADLAVAAAAPMMVVSRGPDAVQGVKDLIRAAEASPDVRAIASRLGVTPRDLVRTSSEFKTFVPRDPSGNEQFVEEWADTLGRALDRFPKESMPTTSQVIEGTWGDAGSSLTGLRERLGSGKDGRSFPATAAGRKEMAVRALRDEYDGLLEGGGFESIDEAYKAVRSMRKQAADALWRRLETRGCPTSMRAR